MCVWVLRSGLLLHLCGDDDILLPIRLILCIPCLSISLYPSLSLSLSLSLSQPFVLFMPRPLSRPEILSFTCRARWQIKTPSTSCQKELFKPTHIHTYTRIGCHTQEGLVNRVACWVRECVLVSNRGQSRSEEEARCDPKTFAQSFLLKKKLANRTRQIWRLQTPAKSAALPLLWRYFCQWSRGDYDRKGLDEWLRL